MEWIRCSPDGRWGRCAPVFDITSHETEFKFGVDSNGEACDLGRHLILPIGMTPSHKYLDDNDHSKGVFDRYCLHRRTKKTSMALPGLLYSEQFAGDLPWVRMCPVSSRNSTKVSGKRTMVGAEVRKLASRS